MRMNRSVEKQVPAPDIQRRINAGWLRLWRTVWPNIPPPVKVQSLKSKVQSREERRPAGSRSLESKVQSLKSPGSAAGDYLSRFLCAVFALALLATGCAGTRPLRGGKAVTTRKPAGTVEQTLVQGENPSQASKQTQESVKVRTYTLPVGSRIEQSLNADCGVRSAEGRKAEGVIANAQPSTSFVLSAAMPVVEREETHAATELGAAQKDTARELGAKLSSLKGIVWVGVGLFVFGLGSLVYPPLKLIIGSVTTSAALMLGGIALMVLPTLIVGNELLILGGVALAVGGWFLAHRHGQLRGMVGTQSKV